MPVLIVGGGIMAASTAYYLAKLGKSIIILERETVGCSASGKAGGFLARGWCSSGPTQQLHHRGFDLIRQYVHKHGLKSYRAIPTAQTEIHGNKRRRGDGQCSWLDRGTTKSSLMDSETAQITPLELTKSLIREAIDLGSLEVRTDAKVVDVVIEEDGKAVTGVVLEDGSIVYGSEVVLAMGAWSCEVEVWPSLRGRVEMPMSGIKSSSLVYKETGMAAVPDPHALFCSDDANGCHLEVYPRPDGDIYVCGLGGSPQLRPDDLRSIDPSGVQPEAKRVAAGHKSLSAMTSLVDPGKEPDIKQACLRPLLPDALPAMGRLCEGINNLYIVAGHNCWGILWSLASGEAMAELIAHGTSEHLSLSPFDPTRFT